MPGLNDDTASIGTLDLRLRFSQIDFIHSRSSHRQEKFPLLQSQHEIVKMSIAQKKTDGSEATETQSVHSSIGRSSRRAGMESSVLRWKDVNFVADKGKKEKHILRDVSGKVLWGHTLAIMGPSGAGSKSGRATSTGMIYENLV